MMTLRVKKKTPFEDKFCVHTIHYTELDCDNEK